jgi:hypothetical protein
MMIWVLKGRVHSAKIASQTVTHTKVPKIASQTVTHTKVPKIASQTVTHTKVSKIASQTVTQKAKIASQTVTKIVAHQMPVVKTKRMSQQLIEIWMILIKYLRCSLAAPVDVWACLI